VAESNIRVGRDTFPKLLCIKINRGSSSMGIRLHIRLPADLAQWMYQESRRRI
jgi:hypothetical protein